MARNLVTIINKKRVKEQLKAINYIPVVHDRTVRLEDPRMLAKTVRLRDCISKFTPPKVSTFGSRIILEHFMKWAR